MTDHATNLVVGEQPAAITNEDLHLEYIRTTVIGILREAAADDELWQQAIHNPRQFLAQRGVDLPAEIRFTLLQTPKPDASSTDVACFSVGELMALRGSNQPHLFCTDGLVPIAIRTLEEICTRQLDAWIPQRDPITGAITGYTHVLHCLKKEWQFVTRWYCGLQTL